MSSYEIVESWDGFKWAIGKGKGHEHDAEVLSKGEISVLKTLKSIVSSDMVFCDVGAFAGYYTVRLAPLVREVHSFEPNPISRDTLIKNIELNRLTNVKVYPYALGDRNEVKKLYLRAPSSTLLEGYGGLGSVDVEVKKMDELIDWIDIAKIDVEGYEWNVVQGMAKLIEKCKPTLIIEHHDFRGYRISTCDVIKNLLKSIGYHAINVTEPHKLYYHSSKPLSKIRDVISNYWINYCITNIISGRAWYHGLPYTWWWGMSLTDFIHEIPEHVEKEEQWIKLIDP